MRRHMDAGLAGALAAVALAVGLAAGFALGINVEARQRLFLGPPPEVVEGARPAFDRCDAEEWVVSPGETVDGIIKRCFPGSHYGKMREEIRALNPDIPDLGRIWPDDRIVLPKRER